MTINISLYTFVRIMYVYCMSVRKQTMKRTNQFNRKLAFKQEINWMKKTGFPVYLQPDICIGYDAMDNRYFLYSIRPDGAGMHQYLK